MKEEVIQYLQKLFAERGDEMYGKEAVTQRQHALQSAMLAMDEVGNADPELVLAALMHDIGHIMNEEDFPSDLESNLDDSHEDRAYPWILENFGARVADPVRLHVAAKRYLCTVDADYAARLSPTSYKSYLDQGGNMDDREKLAFEAEPHFREAVQLRRWDDAAKDPAATTPGLEAVIKWISRT